jgi:hypothetical protein
MPGLAVIALQRLSPKIFGPFTVSETLHKASVTNSNERERCDSLRPKYGFTSVLILVIMSGLSIHPEGVKFEPERDIPDLTGRNILVTGGRLYALLSWA